MAADSRSERSCCAKLYGTLLTVGLTVLAYWAVFQPHHIRARVDAATLSAFALPNSTAALSYHLAVALSLYNPSLRVGVYYDRLDAALYYGGALLGAANATAPAEFFQRQRSGTVVRPEFEGRAATGVAGEVFGKEKGEGFFNLEMRVDAAVRYKFGGVKIRQKPRIQCWMRIPAPPESGGGPGVLGSGDRCSVKY